MARLLAVCGGAGKPISTGEFWASARDEHCGKYGKLRQKNGHIYRIGLHGHKTAII